MEKVDQKITQEGEGILAIIPARGGSKGIPQKNSKILGGKPLLAHAVEFAVKSPEIERVILSTDDSEIADMGLKYGAEVPFIRPLNLATDEAPMIEVVLHALDRISKEGWRPAYVVLLQPTSPFRRQKDLSEATSIIRNDSNIDSIVSVEKVPMHYSPHFLMKIEDGVLGFYVEGGHRVTRRQDAPPAYARNGQFYITRSDIINDQKSIYGKNCIPFETEHEAVNLDTMDDWIRAEMLFSGHCN